MRIRISAAAVLLATAVLPTLACGAEAAVQPGTPVAVAPGVPDQGRSWELVTPQDEISALIYNLRALSADGNRLSYMTFGPLPGAPAGAPFPTANFAERNVSSWTTHPAGAPYPTLGAPDYFSVPFYPGPLALSPDLSTSIWTNYLPLTPGETENEVGLLRRAPDGAFALIGEVSRSGRFIGASEDTQHVFFTSYDHLLAGDAERSEGRSIYEIDGSTLHLLDVGDDDVPLSDCGSTILEDEDEAATDGAISSDGQRIFFTTHPACAGPARGYLREDGATTTEISASQCDLPDCGPEADAYFAGATPSGSSAFIVSAQRLTDEDTNSHPDLYRYDVAAGKLRLLSEQGGIGLSVAAEPARMSADGARVYFRASPQAGPEAGGEEHVYLADERGLHTVGPPEPLAGLSVDGRFALLSTRARLVAGDTDERLDLYCYDAESGAVTPISVEGPAGGNGPFDAVTTPQYFAETASSQPYRSMTDDGSRIFFSTEERLVPEDRNEALDVYEWADGKLGLISSGAGDRPDVYLGATPDGRTVLFRTTATLLPSDRDGGEMDFYAARIGGGFPESSASQPCGGACPSAAPQHADRGVPASAKPRHGGIGLRLPGRAGLRQFAASGWITLLVEAPKAGHLSAEVRTRTGGHTRTIAATEVDLAQAGPVRLWMRLSRQARGRLASGDRLRVRLRLHLSGLATTRRASFGLGGSL